jgi:hypothetical protein
MLTHDSSLAVLGRLSAALCGMGKKRARRTGYGQPASKKEKKRKSTEVGVPAKQTRAEKLGRKLKKRKLSAEEQALKKKGDKELKAQLLLGAQKELDRRIQTGRRWMHPVQSGVWQTEYASSCREVADAHAVDYNTLQRRWMKEKQKPGPKASVAKYEKRMLKQWADAQLAKQRTPTKLEIQAKVLEMTTLRGSPIQVSDWWVKEWEKNYNMGSRKPRTLNQERSDVTQLQLYNFYHRYGTLRADEDFDLVL